MTGPRLWVWIGSDDDKLDVLRYVRATDMDMLRQPVVQREIDTLRATLDLSRSEAGSLGLDLDAATEELELLQDDIAEHLPRYVLDDGTDEPANARETVEYAGAELKQLAAKNARLREVLEHALEWLDEEGCDCGIDEPGTCALCETRAVLDPGQGKEVNHG